MNNKKLPMKWIDSLAIFNLILVLFITSPVEADHHAYPLSREHSYEAIDAYLEEQLEALNIPGASLVIVEGEQIVHLKGGKEVTRATTTTVADWLENQPDGTKFYLGFPLHEHKGHSLKEEVDLLRKRGFFRIYSNKKLIDLNEEKFPAKSAKDIRVIIERLKSEKGKIREKLSDSIEVTFKR